MRGISQAGEAAEERVLLSAVSVDFDPYFNVDGIANRTGGVDDLGSGLGVDSSSGLLVTNSYALNQSAQGNGLPDDGFFPANAFHASVQLGYRNTDNGNNVLRLSTPVGELDQTIDVPDASYWMLDLAAFATEGSATFSVILNYSNGSRTSLQATAPDWFDEIVDGTVTGNATQYYLINGMDRYDGFANEFHDANDPALFGFRFNVDPSLTLTSVTVGFDKSDDLQILNVLGMTLRQPPPTGNLIVDSMEDGIDGDVSPGNTTLREAIHYANLRPGPDTIVFAAPPIGQSGALSYTPLNTPYLITSDITMIGNGQDRTVLSGLNTNSLIQIGNEGGQPSQANVTIRDLTFRNNGAPVRGGGLLNFGTLTVDSAAFNGLYAYDPVVTAPKGGAIYNDGVLNLNNVIMEGNYVSDAKGSTKGSLGYGGAIYNDGQITISAHSIISSNVARFGGAFYNAADSILRLRDSFVGDNIAHQSGGAISAAPGSLVNIDRSRIVDNVARSAETNLAVQGGAVRLFAATLTIDESLFTGNKAVGNGVDAADEFSASGGAIDSLDGSITINRSTFAYNSTNTNNSNGNRPLSYGGAVYNASSLSGQGSAEIRNSTFSFNSANSFLGASDDIIGGGVMNASGSSLSIFDSTFYENSAGAGIASTIYNSGTTSISNSIIKGGGNIDVANRGGGTISTSYSAFTGVSDGFNDGQNGNILIPSIFLLGPLQDNGGPVPTQLPLPDSVVIDSGLSTRFTDQRNMPVQKQKNAAGIGIHDMGAVELQQVLDSRWEETISGQSQFGTGDAAVFGFGFDDGQADADGDGKSDLSGVQKAPEFLGFHFNPDTFTIGGIAEGLFGDRYGAELTADVSGRFGLQYGFYANSGSVDISNSGQFGFGVEQSSNGNFSLVPSLSFDDGSLYAISPRFGAYADLVTQFNADLTAEAAVIFSARGSKSFGFDKTIPLVSINRPGLVNGAMVMDGEIKIAGSSAISGLFDALTGSEDDLNKAKADRRRAEERLSRATNDADRTAAKAAITEAEQRRTTAEAAQKNARDNQRDNGTSFGSAKSLIGFELSEADGNLLGLQGTLSVGLGGSSGGVGAEIGKNLGSLAITIPDIALVTNTLQDSRGVLRASTTNFAKGSEQDLKRQLAQIKIDLGALTGIGGVTNLSLGPIGVEFQTVSYIIQPTLSVNQTITAVPYIKGLSAVFSAGTTVSVNGIERTSNGGLVTYLPADHIEATAATVGQDITVTPTAILGSRLVNKIGLDAQLQGIFEALSFELDFAGETLIDEGPLFRDVQNLGSFELGTVFNRTFDLPDRTITLAPIVLGTASTVQGIAPGNPLPIDGSAEFKPSAVGSQGTVYTSVTMLRPGENLFTSLDLNVNGSNVTGIGVLEDGLVVDTLNASGNVVSTTPLVPGVMTTVAQGTRFRVRPYSADKLIDSTQAMVAVRFANPDANVTMTATPGDPISTRITAPATGTGPEQIQRDAVDANTAMFEQNTGVDVDGDGRVDAATDGLLLLRYMHGVRGQALVTDAVSPTARRKTAAELENYIANVLAAEDNNRLDVDGNGVVQLETDGVLLIRYMAGFSGSHLLEGALGNNPTRTTSEQIIQFLNGSGTNIADTTQFSATNQTRNRRDAIERSAPHDLDALAGSTPWTALTSIGPQLTLSTVGTPVSADHWFLKDSAASTNQQNWQFLGTIVRGDSERLAPLLVNNVNSQTTQDNLTARLTVVPGTVTLGENAPLYVHVPDAAGYTISTPQGVTISSVTIPHDVRGNAALRDTLDVFVPATNTWYTVPTDSTFTFPAPVQQFRIYNRSLPERSFNDAGDVTATSLALRIGLELVNATTSTVLTATPIGGGPRTVLSSPGPIPVSGTSDIVVSRNGATFTVSKNGSAALSAIEAASVKTVTLQGSDETADIINLTLNSAGGPAALPMTILGGGDTASDVKDKLVLMGSGNVMDLTSQYQISGLEEIDLSGTGANTLRVNLSSIQNNQGTNRTLIVHGDMNDRLEFSTADWTTPGDGWRKAGVESIGSVNYDIYNLDRTVAGIHRTENATVKVQQGMIVTQFTDHPFAPSLMSAFAVPGTTPVTGPSQSLTASVQRVDISPGKSFSAGLNYSQLPGSAADPSIFVMRVHYDSSQVTFVGTDSLFADGLKGIQDGPETESDGDSSTDRMVTVLWSRESAAWATGDLSRFLGNVTFQTTSSFDGTSIRTSATTAMGFGYTDGGPIAVMLDGPWLTAPSGLVDGSKPAYQWRAIPNAESYRLFVENLSNGRTTVVDTVLSGTSYQQSAPLPIGRYRAWTQANFSDGSKSTWNTMHFQISADPAIHQLPYELATFTPTISWNSVPGAVRYEIQADNITTGQRKFIYETDIATTQLIPSSPLGLGVYRIWVRAFAADGFASRWSNAAVVFAGPRLTSPLAATLSVRPTFSWLSAPDAASYQLWVQTGKTVVVNTSGIEGTTFTPAVNLPLGNYHWWVRPIPAAGSVPPWSQPGSFTITNRPALQMSFTSTLDTTPTFQWTDLNPAHYELWVNQVGGPAKVIHEVNLTENTYVPSQALENGQYTVWVRTMNADAAPGFWSNPVTFQMDYRVGPSTISPAASVIDSTPQFSWQAVDHISRYDLWVNNLTTGQVQIIRAQNIAPSNSSATVSYSDSKQLLPGDYRWWVRAVSVEGRFAAWSAAAHFTISVPEIVGPSGNISTAAPVFRWDGGPEYVSYELFVNHVTTSTARVIHVNNITEKQYQSDLPLESGAFRYWVRGFDAEGNASQWSPMAEFTITADIEGSPVAESPFGTTHVNRPTLTWTAVPGKKAYQILIKQVNILEQPVIFDFAKASGTSFTLQQPLTGGLTYRWWIRTIDHTDGTAGVWSQPLTFRITSSQLDSDAGRMNPEGALSQPMLTESLRSESGPWVRIGSRLRTPDTRIRPDKHDGAAECGATSDTESHEGFDTYETLEDVAFDEAAFDEAALDEVALIDTVMRQLSHSGIHQVV